MGIVDVVVEWRRQCEIDPTGPRRGIVADVAERGGGSVDCTCSEYGDLTPAGGSKKFERPRSNFFGIFYYTLNIFIGKNASKVASIDETGHRD